MKTYISLILSIIFLMSLPAYAHPGHDHSSVFSNIVHLLWLIPAFVALAMVYTKVLKKNYRIKVAKKQLKEGE